MDANSLSILLLGTLSPNPEERKRAEDQIDTATQGHDITPLLLSLCQHPPNNNADVARAAAMFLGKRWNRAPSVKLIYKEGVEKKDLDLTGARDGDLIPVTTVGSVHLDKVRHMVIVDANIVLEGDLGELDSLTLPVQVLRFHMFMTKVKHIKVSRGPIFDHHPIFEAIERLNQAKWEVSVYMEDGGDRAHFQTVTGPRLSQLGRRLHSFRMVPLHTPPGFGGPSQFQCLFGGNQGPMLFGGYTHC